MSHEAEFSDALNGLLPSLPAKIAVAVSGGSDSLAVMYLAASWAERQDCVVDVVSVDHGLRPEAADEVAMVERLASELGMEHNTLRWQGWDGQGNLQDAARQARRGLIADWAAERGIRHILLGHTLDDQAETVLMRLSRGSGVDGLAGMAPASEAEGLIWLRPVLGMRRQDLRDFLKGKAVNWVDDPSNTDDRFDRVKARQMAETLAPLGLTPERLAQTADHMQSASWALRLASHDLARRVARQDGGDVVFDLDELALAPRELQTRLLSSALGWVSGQGYRPRFRALVKAMEAVGHGRDSTLQGCQLLPAKGELRICREAGAVRGARCPADEIWDNRWQVEGPDLAKLEIAALGEAGLAQCPSWRESGVPRKSLLATPALWQDDELVAAPMAGMSGKHAIHLIEGREDYTQWVLSH